MVLGLETKKRFWTQEAKALPYKINTGSPLPKFYMHRYWFFIIILLFVLINDLYTIRFSLFRLFFFKWIPIEPMVFLNVIVITVIIGVIIIKVVDASMASEPLSSFGMICAIIKEVEEAWIAFRTYWSVKGCWWGKVEGVAIVSTFKL